MAAWQFKVCLIPQSWFNTNGIDISRFYDAEGNYDASFTWKNHPVNDVKGEIIKYYPLSKSWHEDIVSFGDEEKTDGQVWYEKGKLEDIQFRIDMRGNFVLDIEQIIAIAQKLSCVFFIPEQKCIAEPNVFKVISHIKKSNAYLFAKDTEQWFNSIENHNK
ncbi:hypothetical protein [Acinetobacter sp. NIPH 298]|uniref:hypothetical protein n=1 Tax=Acinetobacter sp. NIPH 298 TaxID=1217692 RepID=UPI0002CE52E5|nr:hypothetical protein [Acinetobacter sp. NIPH 298]ENW93818.1 hypothetical protein F903_03249 [Acinetobacter sp. NIPH 298]